MVDVINSQDFNDEIILSVGYLEYEPCCIDSEAVTKRFQRWFTDDIGKRYAIDIKKWDFAKIGSDIGVKYEFEVQVRVNDKPINITMFNGWNIEEVEYYMDKLWSTGMYDYYERWEE